MKKRVKVRSQAQAEDIMVAFLRVLVTQGPEVGVRGRSGPYDWHDCEFRGKQVSVNNNRKITIDGFEIPSAVCLLVGDELRAWTSARLKEQSIVGMAKNARRYEQRVCALAEELAAAG